MSKNRSIQSVIRRELDEFRLLMHSVPALVVTLFVVSVILMNLLANREFNLNLPWLALDCGFTMSWMSFLAMDMLAKRFGGKASFEISLVAIGISLFMSLCFFIIMKLPGNWGEFYTYEDINVNKALDATFAGTWFVIMGSAIAFVSSAAVNAIINVSVGKLTTSNGFFAYAARSWISTAIAQFVDNMLFATIVSHTFFGWTWTQVFTCSLTGCIVELLCEVIFSPLGYKVCKKWEAEGVGAKYLEK